MKLPFKNILKSKNFEHSIFDDLGEIKKSLRVRKGTKRYHLKTPTVQKAFFSIGNEHGFETRRVSLEIKHLVLFPALSKLLGKTLWQGQVEVTAEYFTENEIRIDFAHKGLDQAEPCHELVNENSEPNLQAAVKEIILHAKEINHSFYPIIKAGHITWSEALDVMGDHAIGIGYEKVFNVNTHKFYLHFYQQVPFSMAELRSARDKGMYLVAMPEVSLRKLVAKNQKYFEKRRWYKPEESQVIAETARAGYHLIQIDPPSLRLDAYKQIEKLPKGYDLLLAVELAYLSLCLWDIKLPDLRSKSQYYVPADAGETEWACRVIIERDSAWIGEKGKRIIKGLSLNGLGDYAYDQSRFSTAITVYREILFPVLTYK